MAIPFAHEARHLTEEFNEINWNELLKELEESIRKATVKGMYQIKFWVKNPAHQERLFDYLTERGYEVEWLSTFPPMHNEDAECFEISWLD